jgi:hypothetical protein
VAIDADDSRGAARAERPGGAPDSSPAAEVHDIGRRRRAFLDRPENLSNRQQVKRAVEQRERRPFSGGIESCAGCK